MEDKIKEETPQYPENFPIKKKKPWLIITLIMLIVTIFGTIGVLTYQNYVLKNQIQIKEDILKGTPTTNPNIETKIPDINSPNIIRKGVPIGTIEGDRSEYKTFQYIFQINGDTKISVKTDPSTKRYQEYTTKSTSNINDRGNIFLESQGEEKLLIKDISMFQMQGDPAVNVYFTNVHNIYLITTDYGSNYYYLDLDKKDISSLSIKIADERTEWNDSIILVKNNYKNVIGVKIIDECEPEGEQERKKAEVIDITINDKTSGILKNRIPINCSVGMWGMGDTWIKEYKPDISLETIGVENDYSKFYFKFKLLNHDPQDDIVADSSGNAVFNEPEIVLEKSFYIDISDFDNPQILE